MKYGPDTDADGQGKRSFREWLLKETAQALRCSKSNPDQVRTDVFLYLHRAYEAQFTADEIVELLGIAKLNVLDEAGFASADQEAVLAEYERLDPIIAKVYGQD